MNGSDAFDLDGTVCVITGGSGVLCSEMAKAVGRRGATVVLLARGEEGLQETSEELAALDIDHITTPASVTDRAQLEAAAEATVEEYGRIDALINGAGGNDPVASPGLALSHSTSARDPGRGRGIRRDGAETGSTDGLPRIFRRGHRLDGR